MLQSFVVVTLAEGKVPVRDNGYPILQAIGHLLHRVNTLQGFSQFGVRAWLHAVAGPDHAGFAIDREAEPAADDAGGLGMRMGMHGSYPILLKADATDITPSARGTSPLHMRHRPSRTWSYGPCQ